MSIRVISIGLVLCFSQWFQEAVAEPVSFDLKGKVRERDGQHEFFIPKPTDEFALLILPGEPRELCAGLSEENAAMIKDLEGLEMGRYRIAGEAVLDESGKKHIVTSITEMEPLGSGVIRSEDREITGTLEVRGDPAAEDWLSKSDMVVHGDEGTSYRIPAKKFNLKPSGLSYQDAAELDGQKVAMKAYVQIYRQLPYRVAKIESFVKSE